MNDIARRRPYMKWLAWSCRTHLLLLRSDYWYVCYRKTVIVPHGLLCWPQSWILNWCIRRKWPYITWTSRFFLSPSNFGHQINLMVKNLSFVLCGSLLPAFKKNNDHLEVICFSNQQCCKVHWSGTKMGVNTCVADWWGG